MRKGKAVIITLVVLVILVAAAIGFISLTNSPTQVALKWAGALSRKDEVALKKLVLAKDQGRVAGLINATKFLHNMTAQFSEIEDRQGQKVAKIAIKFSGVSVGNFRMKLNGTVQLPFVLAREKLLFWRVDLEKSEAPIREEVRRAILEAIRRDPQLRSLLQFIPGG